MRERILLLATLAVPCLALAGCASEKEERALRMMMAQGQATRVEDGPAVEARLEQLERVEAYRPVVASLVREALARGQAYEMLASLCATAPHRLSGSPGAAAAVAWGQRAMTAAGLENVRLQPCLVPTWVRGEVERLTLLSPPDSLQINAAQLEAVMLRPFETDLELEQAAANVDAAIIGPAAGVNETTLLNVLALARTGAALVIDVDAITVFRDDPEELFSVLDRDDVLTPHIGEFERLFPAS